MALNAKLNPGRMFSSNGLLFLIFGLTCLCICWSETVSFTPVSDSKALKQLRKNTKVSQDRCQCEKQECSCCAKFSIEGKGEEGCASFKVPDGKTRNKLVRYSFNFNDQTTNQVAPAGRDPKGVCQPWRRYPGITICSRYHSTTVENGKIRWCLTMEGKYMGYTFYEMEFDCVTYDVENQVQVGTK